MADNCAAESPLRVFADGAGAQDARVTHPRTLDDVYSFPNYADKSQWEHEAGQIRQHILVSTGLQPMPEKCPLKPHISGRIEREGYAVERVLLQTWPGFYLGGNLYRPRGAKGPHPAVICPHGHWQRGRLQNDPELGSLPGRYINLARQGHVTFAYDMIGYNDTFQLPHDFGGERETLWGLSILGLQLWNSIRAVDFVQSLPEVDARRIGVTGASGGGSQTFLLTAVEPRITASLPAVMVSAHMQGGCLCENAPCLRLEYSNVQIAACTAPRPLHLIACTGDWTKYTADVEFPAIRSIYRLYGAEDKVSFFIQQANHNYNLASRESCYAFFGKHLLGEGDADKLRETPFKVETDADLLALPDKRPVDGAPGRSQVVRTLIDGVTEQFAEHTIKDKASLDRYRKSFGPVLRHAMSIRIPDQEELVVEALGSVSGAGWSAERLVLGRQGIGDRSPALLLTPAGRRRPKRATILVHEYGKAALMAEGLLSPGKLIEGLLEAGHAVLALDAFLCGEHNPQAGIGVRRDRSPNHFSTYNRPDVVERAQDILTAVAAVNQRLGIAGVCLAGLGEAGLWALLAAAAAPKPVKRLAADMARFDPDRDAEFIQRLNIPHIRRAGDVPTLVALHAPRPLMLHNLSESFDAGRARAIYRACDKSRALTTRKNPVGDRALAGWLVASGPGSRP